MKATKNYYERRSADNCGTNFSITLQKIEKVWNAITDKDEMKKWYFDLAEFKPEPGFEFQFYGEGKQGEKFLHLCKSDRSNSKEKLTY